MSLPAEHDQLADEVVTRVALPFGPQVPMPCRARQYAARPTGGIPW